MSVWDTPSAAVACSGSSYNSTGHIGDFKTSLRRAALLGIPSEENRKYMPPEPVEAEDEAIGEAVGGPKTKNGAVRSYLTSTITPALLRGLMELDKEERDRPVLWLAQFLESYDPSGV